MSAQQFISKVIGLGRVTIPKHIRELHNIGNGDYVELQILRKITNKTQGA